MGGMAQHKEACRNERGVSEPRNALGQNQRREVESSGPATRRVRAQVAQTTTV
jgi:hypothetical protein